MERSEYVKRFNNLIAAVSDSDKESARHFLFQGLVNKLLEQRDDAHLKRLCDDLMVAWYDTYKHDGRGPWLPREAAGIPRNNVGGR